MDHTVRFGPHSEILTQEKKSKELEPTERLMGPSRSHFIYGNKTART